MQKKPFSRIGAAAADGRLENVFFRQEQLKGIHDALVRHADAIQVALIRDTGYNVADATVEYCLALKAIRKRYDALDPTQELEDEYRIAKGKNAPNRREAVGIAYIVPTSHSPLFSVISPVASAIAAGSCVILELPQTLRELPSLLGSTLQQSLDPDIFEISTARPADKDFLRRCVLVLQTSEAVDQHYPHLLLSPSRSRVVAVVDRTADLKQAADALVAARLRFKGQSPYAPDLVLVNEFAKKQFLNAVVQESIKYMTESNSVTLHGTPVGNGLPVRSLEKQPVSLLEEITTDQAVRIVISGSNGAVLDAESRNARILQNKVGERCLAVHAVTSIDDAIDFANSLADTTLLATYIFGSPDAAKYLGQFIKSDVTCVNYIPTELLVGPAAPSHLSVDPSDRYPTDFFSVIRPQYISSSLNQSALSTFDIEEDSEKLQAMKIAAMANLKVTKRPDTYGIGFFEQGILTGLALVGIPILGALTAGAVYGIKYGLRAWRIWNS